MILFKMRIYIAFIAIFAFLFAACNKKDLKEINLSGNWYYRLDSLELGEKEKWFQDGFIEQIQLPGALRDYEIGEEPDLHTEWTGSIYDSSWYFNPELAKYRQEGDMKFPFWLTPVKHYVGMAWYQKEIEIPAAWIGKDVVLNLERPHWQTTIWFDTIKIGSDNSLSVPHQFVIPGEMATVGKHKLTLKIDNAIRDVDPGINSHSISDHTQGNWNGVVGEIYLETKNKLSIKQIKVTPDLANKSIEVMVKLSSLISKGQLDFSIKGYNHHHDIGSVVKVWEQESDSLVFSIPMGDDFKTWSEFSPDFYELTVGVKSQEKLADVKKEVFGMREFTIVDKHFEINGTQTFLRGTTDCCVFPLTGYPPTAEQEWARIYNVCKSFGLNHVRFHSYCPPEAAFIAADKAGIYLQVEGPSWAKYSASLGYGKPIDAYLMEETKRIIDTYGNHPSFCMMAYGNEPSGKYVDYLNNWVDHFKAYDPQRIFTGASTGGSWHIIPHSEYLCRARPRGLEWKDKQPESMFDYNHKTENQDKPYVTFEMGQWCVFPNFKEIDKYTGSLKAKNFELFQENLADNGMVDMSEKFLMASGKLQASCYKQEIEATLRTENLTGFQLLSLNDFSGQGTALVGVLDAFWDEKGYISAEEFKAFCNRVVPLVRLPKFTFESKDTLKADIEIANFSGEEMIGKSVSWKLIRDSVVANEGMFTPEKIAIGHNNEVGVISLPLDFVSKAGKYTLSVNVGEYLNSWNIWVYPSDNDEFKVGDVLVVNEIDKSVEKALADGKSVLLLAAGKVENGKDVVQYLVPAFWNTSWFRMRPPHTTGVYIQNEHPVFKDFPTDYYSDLQWWEIANRQQSMNLENFDPKFRPIVQPIDTWFLNRRLAMLFEARVGKGKLMVCSIDLTKGLDNRLVARQLKKSIMQYMNSDKFNPESEVDQKVINELFEEKEREVWNSYVNATP